MIVEDGTGVINANSYASLADATTYFADRGVTAWASASTSQQSAALIIAADYIEATYAAAKPVLVTGQGLQFPSRDPAAFAIVKRAAMTFALESLTVQLSTRIERGMTELEQKLDGVGMTITKYDPAPITDHYPQITAMLAPYAALRAAGVRTGRVSRHEPGMNPKALNVANGFGYGGWGVFTGWDATL